MCMHINSTEKFSNFIIYTKYHLNALDNLLICICNIIEIWTT